MAATLYFNEYNGVPGEEIATSKVNEAIQFKLADDAIVEDYETCASPVKKPSSGVCRSYEKYLRIHLESLNGGASVSNLRLYSVSPPVPGVSIWVKTAEAYDEPLTGGYTPAGAMVGSKTNISSYTLANPLVLAAGPFVLDNRDIGPFLVLQLEAFPSASVGEVDLGIMVDYEEA